MKIEAISCDYDDCSETRPDDKAFFAESSSDQWGRVIQAIRTGRGTGRGKTIYRTVDLCFNHRHVLDYTGLDVALIGGLRDKDSA